VFFAYGGQGGLFLKKPFTLAPPAKTFYKPSQLKVFGSPEPFFQKGFWPPEPKAGFLGRLRKGPSTGKKRVKMIVSARFFNYNIPL
jgi:hypothetical protein